MPGLVGERDHVLGTPKAAVFDHLRLRRGESDLGLSRRHGGRHRGEKGVGAIYLGNVASDFALKSLATNESQGQVRSTGVFLKENGAVGTMQQVDLAI